MGEKRADGFEPLDSVWLDWEGPRGGLAWIGGRLHAFESLAPTREPVESGPYRLTPLEGRAAAVSREYAELHAARLADGRRVSARDDARYHELARWLELWMPTARDESRLATAEFRAGATAGRVQLHARWTPVEGAAPAV